MAVFHYVHLRTFVHETEDPGRVRQALARVTHGAQVPWTETHVEGSHGNRILILEGDVRSAPGVKRMFEGLAADDPAGFERLVAEASRRVDENLNFHLRLDKQEAYLGRSALAEGDDAITIRAKIRSFKSKRSGEQDADAVQALSQFLHGVGTRNVA